MGNDGNGSFVNARIDALELDLDNANAQLALERERVRLYTYDRSGLKRGRRMEFHYPIAHRNLNMLSVRSSFMYLR